MLISPTWLRASSDLKEGGSILTASQMSCLLRLLLSTSMEDQSMVATSVARTSASVSPMSMRCGISALLVSPSIALSLCLACSLRERGEAKRGRGRARKSTRRRGKTPSAAARNGRTTCAAYARKERPNAPERTRFVGFEETSTTDAAGEIELMSEGDSLERGAGASVGERGSLTHVCGGELGEDPCGWRGDAARGGMRGHE